MAYARPGTGGAGQRSPQGPSRPSRAHMVRAARAAVSVPSADPNRALRQSLQTRTERFIAKGNVATRHQPIPWGDVLGPIDAVTGVPTLVRAIVHHPGAGQGGLIDKQGRIHDLLPLVESLSTGGFREPRLPKIPKPDVGVLDSASTEAHFRLSAGHPRKQVIAETAQKYSLRPQDLRKHMAGAGKKTVNRILSNEEYWQPKRSIKVGEHNVQFPASPSSQITLRGQRLLDRASERLNAPVKALKGSESAGKRVAGKALYGTTAEGRGFRQGGKLRRQEMRRSAALVRTERETVVKAVKGHPIPFLGDDHVNAAHTIWAQLPEDMRNVEGLKRVREYLAQEHQAELAREHPDPEVVRDQGSQLKKLDALIAKPPQHDEAITGAVQKLMDDREQSLIRSGFDPSSFDARRGLLTRAIEGTDTARTPEGQMVERVPGQENYYKLEREAAQTETVLRGEQRKLATLERKASEMKKPSASFTQRLEARRASVARWQEEVTKAQKARDELGPQLRPLQDRGEIYVGHRQGQVRGARGVRGVSLGESRVPQGVGKQNTLSLFRTGRVKLSLESVLDDWQGAQTYEMHNAIKDELSKMGEPLEGNRLKPDHVLVNPHGEKVPRHWKTNPDEVAAAEGFNPDQVIVRDTEEYVRNYLGMDPADIERIFGHATENNYVHELRQIPLDAVKRYYGEFLTPRVRASIPGLEGKPSGLGKAMDLVNDAVYTGLIYSNPGYIPANTIANLIMAGLQQGAFLPINLIRAGQVILHGPKILKHLMLAEVGEGGTASLASRTSLLRALGSKVSSIADDPYRVSAFLHEAARQGIISKTKPLLDATDYQKLQEWLTDPRFRASVNDARDAGVQAMVDFERLGPMERAVFKRLTFVWSWIRGATRYPVRFAADHPLRTAMMAYVGAGAPGSPAEVQKHVDALLPSFEHGMPPWLEGAIKMGTATIHGKEFPKVLPTYAISPLSTPWQLLQTMMNAPGSQTLGEMISPAITSAWYASHKESPFGRKEGSYIQSIEQNLQGLAPDVKLAQGLIHPKAGGLYPEDATRLGRLKRAVRVLPIAIDPEQAYLSRKRLGMAGDLESMRRHDLIQNSHAAGLGNPPGQVFDDLHWKTRLDNALTHGAQTRTGGLDYFKAAKIVAQLFDERYHSHMESAVPSLTTTGAAEAFYHQIRPHLYPYYARWDSATHRVLTQKAMAQPKK